MKQWLIFLSVFFIGLSFSINANATVVEYQVVYELDGGTNNPNNPESYTELELFYFAEPFKEGFIFEGWFLDLLDPTTKVTLRPIPTGQTLTLFAKFRPNYTITVNPNNGSEEMIVAPVISPKLTEQSTSTNTSNNQVVNTAFVTHPLMSTDMMYHVYLVRGDYNSNIGGYTPGVFVKPVDQYFLISAGFQIGSLPSSFANARLVAIKVVDGKIYGIANEVNDSETSVYVFEIDNTEVSPSTSLYQNSFKQSTPKLPISGFQSSTTVLSNLVITDYNNDGKLDIFIRYLGTSNSNYRIISYTFDHIEKTLTKDLDFMLPITSISHFDFFDFNNDGVKELGVINTQTKNFHIYAYDPVNKNFNTLLTSIVVGNSNTRFFTFDELEIGYFLGGNTPVVIFESQFFNEFSQSSSGFNYFTLDSEMNLLGRVNSIPTFAIFNVNMNLEVFQLDASGIHGVYIHGGQTSTPLNGFRGFYAAKKDGTGFETLQNFSTTAGLGTAEVSAYYGNGISYVSIHSNRQRRVDSYQYASTPTFPTVILNRVGYRFDRFYAEEDLTGQIYNSGMNVTSDIEVYAKWIPNTYPIVYNTQNGTSVPQGTATYDAILSEPIPTTRSHYRFVEWRIYSLTGDVYDFTKPHQILPQFSYQSTVTLFAIWEQLTYKVIHETNSDITIEDHSNLSLTNYTLPNQTVMTREGYTFEGWYLTSDFTSNKVSAVFLDQPEKTAYAKWITGTYEISFKGLGNTIESYTFDFNEAVTGVDFPTPPNVLGYTFKSWEGIIPTVMPGFHVEIIALYDANEHTLTFNTDGGSTIEPITQDFNTAITAPMNPTKEGYTFSGWSALIPTTMPAENITLTATWTMNSYTITFNSNEGTSVPSITQDYNTNVSAPSNPTRVGYTFGGWFTDETLLIPYTFTKIAAEDMTLFAKWTVNDYTITFDSAGGSLVSAITLPYNSDIIKPVDPQRAGYVFNSWNEAVPTVMPAVNKTLTAFWTPITYTITFNANGGVFSQNQVSSYTVESANVTLFEVTRSGYVFKGWYLESTFDTKISEINTKTELRNLTLFALFFTESFQEFLDDVDALPNPLTKEDKEKVVDLLETLKSFSTFEQGYADEDTLLEALTEVKTLEVNYVKTLISSIPTAVTYDDLEKIEAAKEAFDALESNQQEDVTNQEDLNTLLGLVNVLNQIEALKNADDIDEEAYETLVLDFDALTEEQKSLISDTVLTDYQAIQSSMTGIGLLGFIGLTFSLLFLIIIALWYVNKKRKELKKI